MNFEHPDVALVKGLKHIEIIVIFIDVILLGMPIPYIFLNR